MNRTRSSAMCAFVAALAIVALPLRGAAPLAAEQDKAPPSRKAKVYLYPRKLTPKDRLSFGPGKEQIEIIPIKGETTLIYVDLDPGARFAHGTQCILISTEGARVIKGSWWMILNGEELFREDKDVKQHQVDFPIDLSGK